jgi:hypothetical protein
MSYTANRYLSASGPANTIATAKVLQAMVSISRAVYRAPDADICAQLGHHFWEWMLPRNIAPPISAASILKLSQDFCASRKELYSSLTTLQIRALHRSDQTRHLIDSGCASVEYWLPAILWTALNLAGLTQPLEEFEAETGAFAVLLSSQGMRTYFVVDQVPSSIYSHDRFHIVAWTDSSSEVSPAVCAISNDAVASLRPSSDQPFQRRLCRAHRRQEAPQHRLKRRCKTMRPLYPLPHSASTFLSLRGCVE